MNTSKECRLLSLPLETDWCWISLRLDRIPDDVNFTDFAKSLNRRVLKYFLQFSIPKNKDIRCPDFQGDFRPQGNDSIWKGHHR